MARRAAAAAILLAIFTSEVKAADDRLARLEAWLTAVREHEPGAVDGPVAMVARWHNNDIRELWLYVASISAIARCRAARDTGLCAPSMSVKGLDGRLTPVRLNRLEVQRLQQIANAILDHQGDFNQILKRAAILHADVVMSGNLEVEPYVAPPLAVRRSGQSRSAPGPDRVVLQTQDGQQENLVNGAVHMEIGYSLLDLVTDESLKLAPKYDETVRLWYLTTIVYFQSVAMHDGTHFGRALSRFPNDPDFLFHSGCLHESLASSEVQTAVRSARLPTGVVLSVNSERDELQSAERFFRRALEQRPDFHEARLRLGRVLALLGRHADAVNELRGLADRLNDEGNRYYALLFLGAAERALGHRDEAKAAYEGAAELYPSAQSPRVALSQLAHESGDRTAALSAIQEVLDLPVDEAAREDPYWIYHVYSGREVETVREQLYRPFRRTP